MVGISLKSLNKNFGSKKILESLNLDINKNEIVCVLGPNACGKTTLLNIISGLDKPTGGAVLINNKPSSHIKNYIRGYVFQDYNDSLFNHRTLFQNIAFGLEVQKKNKKQIQQKVQNILFGTLLENTAHLYPYQVSGGMKQLTAVMRAFVSEPHVLLLDEPFNALDHSIKLKMQKQLLDVWTQNKKTMIMITHDIDEAVFLADKIVLLTNKPTKVKRIFPINLPRPREHSVMANEEFVKIRTEILKEFMDVAK